LNLRRVVIDIELSVELDAPEEAVSELLVDVDWAAIGARPLRSVVTTRHSDEVGWYEPLVLAGDWGVGELDEP
jgi:hypothetical protein